MNLTDIGSVIAAREFALSTGGSVVVRIGMPEKFPDSPDYYCPYEISGGGERRVRYASGIDSVQALQLALSMIGSDLYTSKQLQEGNMKWEGGARERDLGFPVPKSLSDLLP